MENKFAESSNNLIKLVAERHVRKMILEIHESYGSKDLLCIDEYEEFVRRITSELVELFEKSDMHDKLTSYYKIHEAIRSFKY